jgi:hypothetical protein
VPVLFFAACLIKGATTNKEPLRWLTALFLGFHSLYATYIVALLTFAAIYYQAREISSHLAPPPGLSVAGLAVQFMVFCLVSVSWVFRVSFPYDEIARHRISLQALATWFTTVGWVVVYNGVYGLGQGLLFWLVMRHGSRAWASNEGETRPLLR